MSNKKIVFLFGAGAVMDWGGPRTICYRNCLECIPDHGTDTITNRVCCLTHLINSTGFFAKDGERITSIIYKSLCSKSKEVNFEALINVIEDLYVYWATKKSRGAANLYSIADFDAKINSLHHFEFSSPHSKTRKYSISIPEFSLLNDNFVSDTIAPHEKYYELFLNELLSGIKGHISKYSHHTLGHSVIITPHNEQVNMWFYKWMEQFANRGYILRMYTLNYDRIFKVLLQTHNLDVFEGFELDGPAVDYNQKIPPDLPRIVTDFDSHVFYNLHGSAYWEPGKYNLNGIEGYQYYLVPFGDIDSYVKAFEIEKGKSLLLTNIITGYQKVQRTAVAPFRQMFSAFDRDCFEADIIYVIGYSFGDEHINDIIRNARKFNKKAEIIIIDPGFDESRKKELAVSQFSHWDRIQDFIFENTDYGYKSAQYRTEIYKKPFKEYLELALH